jgi:hypothetical protein
MRPIAWRSLALSSVLAGIALLHAAVRPHYGGVLHMLTLEPLATLNADDPAGALIAETLVTLDEHGEVRPKLAVFWQSEGGARRWRFTLRPRVNFHDGTPLTPAAVASLLSGAVKNTTVYAAGPNIIFASQAPMVNLPRELARHRSAIFRRSGDSALIGTGPFRLKQLELGMRVTLIANEEYWGGRPYLDSVIIERSARASTAGIIELPPNTSTRQIPEKLRISVTLPAELYAISLPANIPQSTRDSLAASIDRSAIANVLLQKRAEPAGGLIPQWLSGFDFLFPRSRRILPVPRTQPIALGYSNDDPVSRLIADRIAVNARDAGIMLQPSPSSAAARLVRIRINSTDAEQALVDVAANLNLDLNTDLSSLEKLYAAERALLADGRVIPIVFVSQLFGLQSNVRGWDQSRPWQLENVWIAP